MGGLFQLLNFHGKVMATIDSYLVIIMYNQSVISTYFLSPTPEPTLQPMTDFSEATFVYDGNGNMVEALPGNACGEFELSSNSRLNCISSSYVIGEVTTYYIGGYYELKVDGSTETETKYYTGPTGRFAMRVEGTLYWIFSDHLQSSTLVLSEVGYTVSRMDYTAFGEVRAETGTSPTDYQYTGQRSYLDSFDLHYYVARWYDPYLNQFIQPDTLIPDPGNSADWNRYAYVLYNPMRYIDPTGHYYVDDIIPGLTNDSSWWSYQNPNHNDGYYLDYVEIFSTRVSYFSPTDHLTDVPADTSVWYAAVWDYQAQSWSYQKVDLPFRVAAVEVIMELSLQAAKNISYNKWLNEAPDDFLVYSVNVVRSDTEEREFLGLLITNLSNVPIRVSIDSQRRWTSGYRAQEFVGPFNKSHFQADLLPGPQSGAFVSNSIMGISQKSPYSGVYMNFRTPMFIDPIFRWGILRAELLQPFLSK